MRSQNKCQVGRECRTGCLSYRNFNALGRAGCVGLAVLAFMLVNPVVGNSASALEEIDEEGGDMTAPSPADDPDAVIMPAAATNSTVTISFSPTSANGTVTPIDSNGAKAKVDVKATVRVQNSGGYYVYVGSNSSQLKNGSNVIESVGATTTYANLPVNSWGYSFASGTTAADSYKAMPATLRGTALDSNNNTNIKDETRNYTLSFAANIGADKPAGTYTNQVTMSVVSSPLEVTNKFGIETMQEMTSAVCSQAEAGASQQLRDTRDGKSYLATKLDDGKCWMTQNLDYSLSNGKFPTGYYTWNEAKTVCPSGWGLPTSSEFRNLLSAYSITSSESSMTKLMGSPLNFVKNGYVKSGTTVATGVGERGGYWSSTIAPYTIDDDSVIVYLLSFSGTDKIQSDAMSEDSYGYSVRCIAK